MPRIRPSRLLPAALACYCLCLGLCFDAERRLFPEPQSDWLRAQEAGEGGEGAGASQRIRRDAQAYSADYAFSNFNRDSLSIHYQVPSGDFQAYDARFGYAQKDLDELKAWHESARQQAYQAAVAARKTQTQLDAALAGLKAQYDRRVRDYFASRGFKLEGQTVSVDMPLLVKNNSPWMRSVAGAIDKVADERHYGSDDLIGAVASLVQTALIYKIPPPVVDGVHNGGLLPPVKTLLFGWGDCDTKTGLLSSILSNWPHMRMVGISLPEHYLMGVLRIPNKGDAFVEYDGLQYVLVEPAGPAWLPPGQVGVDTIPMLERPEGYRIEPFF